MAKRVDDVVLSLQNMNWQAFEQFACDILTAKGYLSVQRTRDGADSGIDGFGMTTDGLRVAFQCKHRGGGGGKIGRPDIQSFLGAIQGNAVFGFF